MRRNTRSGLGAVAIALAFVAAGIVVNITPFVPGGYTELLAVLHLPIALWLIVGIAYACQEVEAVPVEPHDAMLPAIATERELIRTEVGG